jgi:hypothetical protein
LLIVDKYSGDHIYTARHEHVAEMVFERVLTEPEARFNQIVRIMGGMNLDFNSDRTAFGQLVRGHGIADALRSRSLGRAFYDAAIKVAPREAFCCNSEQSSKWKKEVSFPLQRPILAMPI